MNFLNGGGEMGALIRARDWSATPVGEPGTWPQSLRTTLSIILHARFPMFLWWGAELICFYNDAYRPSLGENGKHPSILGEKATDAWPEIWHIIEPLIRQVLNGGEATWSEDQLIPIFRNGKLEDAYWTFCYSPVNDESGNVAGVLATCSETTKKVAALRQLEATNRRYRYDILQAPVAMCILRGPDHIVEIANILMLELWGKPAEVMLHRPIFDGLPEARGQGLEQLVQQVYNSGEKYEANERPVLLPRNGKLEITYINFVYDVLTEVDGTILGLVAIATDVTAQVVARQRVEESERRFRNIVQQAPLGITMLRGADFVVEMANETYLQFVDQEEKDFTGKPLFESLPEVETAVAPLLTAVLTTGTPFYAAEFPVALHRYGKTELSYFNLVYHPLREDNGDISGIIVVTTEVTDSVKAKHFLMESEKQFRNLVMQSPIPMAILKQDTYVIEIANKVMYEEIWRKKDSDIIGKSLLDVFPELRDQKYPALLEKVYRTGEVHRETESVAHVGGDDGLRKFYLDFEYSPLLDPAGKVSGIFITVNDVTARVDARKHLEEAEERLRLATEAAELGTWELDLQNGEIIHTPRLAEIFGYGKSERLRHQQLRSMVHPEDRQSIVEKAFELALQTGVYHHESRVIKADGSHCWIRVQGKIFYDDAAQPAKLVGTIKDITEEKLHEQNLLERELKFRLLANSMPQHIWTADPAGKLNYFNQSVFDYSGFTPEQLEEGGWLQIVHPDDRDENARAWMAAISQGSDFLFEHRFRRHDGAYRWQLSRAIPQKDASGNIQMWVGTSTDIQDQKSFASELEKQVHERTLELNEKNKELEAMNTELQSFAYVSSHDLQEPLRKIQTFATRILHNEEEKLSDKGKDYFRRMQDAARRMQILIEDLLAYSRTNTTQRNFEQIDLNQLLDEVKTELKEDIRQKEAVIEANQLCNARVIPFQFRQLVHNLLGNALKFSKPGNPPHIRISSQIVQGSTLNMPALSASKQYCHLQVTDNGIGFEQQYEDRIFEVFQRLHGNNEYKGTGIGLAIVKKIVENHEGIIKATGELDKGATFDIYLPAPEL